MSEIKTVLQFWFDDLGIDAGKSRRVWFSKRPEFDQEIRDRFLPLYHQAATGLCDFWQSTAEGCLALILVLDQFPRNLFRGQPQAFATDGQALTVAQRAIARGLDQQLPLMRRWFIYMPLQHSESLEHQHQSVELFRALAADPETASADVYAVKHLEVMQRFGRFPHRNVILGRESTPEEISFLQQPGSSF